MEKMIKSHTIMDQPPWPYKSKDGTWTNLHRYLYEDIGKWHVFELVDADATERARSSILSKARHDGMKVLTTCNAGRMAFKRVR